ncbi:hypothetical protein IR009_14150 [Pseudomonas putida]|uniref:hypothetical protein n=1 Tax=Pseudomonas putida TaxID=303 RepID=UPI0018A8E60D|nr:hypothetical protein [Pseudomonas putida]MBF8766360.1 hypothetical protein [Pseudomonas putida]
MTRFLQQFEIYTRAHSSFRKGDYSEGMKGTLYLLANGIVKMNARDLYELWESSVEGGCGSDELFMTMVDQGFVEQVLIKAKAGKIEIIKEFLDAVAQLDEDVRYKILKAAE